jgi:metal-dependent amidase/aminoacylase/carboxypeptidase family protein
MEAYLGAENVVDLPARMGGEDFAFYSQQIPACFYRLGVQNPNGSGLHTPNFNVDERSLEVGAGLMAWLAMQP